MRKFMYHKKDAPKGKIFEDEEREGLGDDWVDTPAKFKADKPKNPKKDPKK